MLKDAKKWFKRREGAKQLDIEASQKAFETDYYVYYPDPDLDLEQYTNEEGDIELSKIPPDQLLEFQCRYVTPGEFREACMPSNGQSLLPADMNLEKLQSLEPEQFQKQLSSLIIASLATQESYANTTIRTVFMAITEPKFNSPEHMDDTLPTSLIEMIYEESTKFVEGKNLKMKQE